MNIGYSSQLKAILQTWGTDVLNINIPSAIDQRIAARDIPALFTDYGVEPSFLSNFWSTMMILFISCAVWIVCQCFILCLKTTSIHCLKLLNSILKKVSHSARNFFITTTYQSLGDIVFFSVLEIKSLSLGLAWSNVSLAASVIILTIALCLFVLHLYFTFRYSTLRSSADSQQLLDNYKKRYEALEVLCEDFKTIDIFKHSFLSVLILRDITTALLIALMSSNPLFQSVVLVCLSLIVCGCVLFNNPYRRRFELLWQMMLEGSVLTALMCVLAYAILDSIDAATLNERERLGQAIIIINIIINCVCFLTISMKILELFKNVYDDYYKKKTAKVENLNDASVLGNTSEIHVLNSNKSNNPKSTNLHLDSSLQHSNIMNGVSNSIVVHTPSQNHRDRQLHSASRSTELRLNKVNLTASHGHIWPSNSIQLENIQTDKNVLNEKAPQSLNNNL